jgi:antitoxin (DNA-binding transcriptional repressor) of toxin-antitoxin stability system
MKVKVGELKTHFSKYIRELQEREEPIEVCVREDTVAYLVSAKGGMVNDKETRLKQRLEVVGIRVSRWGRSAESLVSMGTCEKPAGGANSIETIRRERVY